MLKLKQKTILLVGVVLSASLILPLALKAQSSGQGLQISPPIHELEFDPGGQKTITIKLTNVASGTIVAKPQVDDFVAQGEDGQPRILPSSESNEASPYGMRKWFGKIADIQLDAGETKEVEVEITAPKNASPGGHYSVVRFTAVSEEATDQPLSLSASIGSLVLATVSGETKESLKLTEFFTSQAGQRSNLFKSGSILLSQRVTNDGNVHVQPKGDVSIKNIFGQVVATVTANEGGGNILPDSTRKFEQEFGKKILLGRYTAELNLSYGDGKTLTGTATFWVIPYGLLAIVVISLVLLILITRIGLRGYEKRVIKKSNS